MYVTKGSGMLWPFCPSGSCMLLWSWCRVDAGISKTWGSVVEKAKWLWAAFTEEIFVLWFESASLILFTLIKLSVSVCSRPRMSTTTIKRYKSLAFEWNPFVLVRSPSAGHVSGYVDPWARGCTREGDAEFVLLLLKPEFVPKLNLWPASVEVISWICGWPLSSPRNSLWAAGHISIQLLWVFPVPLDNRSWASLAIWMIRKAS